VTAWTAHLRTEREPIVIPERFAWGALLFGPFWLAAHRAWLAAAITLAASILIQVLAPEPFAIVLQAALALLLGLSGHDLRRWSATMRGYIVTNVMIARTETEALGRLLTYRPDLAATFMPARAAR
jgi:Protein of unknown function (DUF2628)